MEINILYKDQDQIYDKDYLMAKINAIELSNYLKKNITDVEDYIIKNDNIFEDISNLKEIYEYQNFFLLKKSDEYILLDGFRRLLVFTVPDIDINVRIYNYDEFSSKEILNLLINLNHTKFVGSLGFYYDRGVCLALDKLFNINISKYHKVLDGYLRHDDTKRSYLKNYLKNKLLFERLLNDMFISDMEFIQSIYKEDIVFLNDIFGVLIYNFRKENGNKILNHNDFIELIKNDESFIDLHDKVKKYGDNNSAKSIEVINKLTESYKKVFDILSGKKVELTFNEKIIEYKKKLDIFKKNKNYIKLTKNRDTFIAEKIIFNNYKKGILNNFKLFVQPLKEDLYNVGYGLVEHGIELVPNENKSYRNNQDFDLYVIIGDTKEKISHGYSNYGRGQTYIDFSLWYKTKHSIRYKIDLFVDISQKEFKEGKIKRYGK
jgi:hypothetical protein